MKNGHIQLEQDWAAKFRPKSVTPFPEWLLRQIRREQTLQQSERGEARQLAGIESSIQQLLEIGTNAVCEVTRSGLSIGPLLKSGLMGTIFVEVAGLNRDVGRFMVRRALQMIDEFSGLSTRFTFGLAIHSLTSTTLDTIRQVGEACQTHDLPLALRLGQHPAEDEALIHGDGPLYHLPGLLKSDNRPDVPGLSAIKFAAAEGLLSLNTRLIYGNTLTEADIPLLLEYEPIVVHCPRSCHILDGGYFPLKAFIDAGVRVEFGSDSLAVVPSLDLREDLAFAADLHQLSL